MGFAGNMILHKIRQKHSLVMFATEGIEKTFQQHKKKGDRIIYQESVEGGVYGKMIEYEYYLSDSTSAVYRIIRVLH